MVDTGILINTMKSPSRECLIDILKLDQLQLLPYPIRLFYDLDTELDLY